MSDRDYTPRWLLYAELIGPRGEIVDRISEKAPYHGARWILADDWDSLFDSRAREMAKNLEYGAKRFGVAYATVNFGKRAL